VRKLIFLDIDGVIATAESLDHGLWGLVDRCQDHLQMILDNTNAEIVISSSWRKHTIQDTIDYFNKKNFKFSDKITGITIRAYHYVSGVHLSIPRGVEIKQWIDTNIHSNNGKDYSRKILGVDFQYVILDDDSDMLLEQSDNFVRTDTEVGLTERERNLAIKILNQIK
jgi:hypothetical protein